jgi:hypothetical protein
VTLNDGQVSFLIHDITAKLLTRAGDLTPERRESLKQAVKLMVPGIDEFELRELTTRVGEGLYGMANLIDQRRDSLVAKGRITPYAGE